MCCYNFAFILTLHYDSQIIWILQVQIWDVFNMHMSPFCLFRSPFLLCSFWKSRCSEFWRWKTVGMSRQECGHFSTCGDHKDHECVLWVSQPHLQNAHTAAATGTLNCTGSQLSSGRPRGYPVLCSQSVLMVRKETFDLKAKSHLLKKEKKVARGPALLSMSYSVPAKPRVTIFFFFSFIAMS